MIFFSILLAYLLTRVIPLFMLYISLFTLLVCNSSRLFVVEKTQAGIKIAGRNINNLRYADDTTLMAESEEELKAS